MLMLKTVLQFYNIDAEECNIFPIASGLINNTWKIEDGNGKYILQRINKNVFKQPEDIAFNINLLAEFFAKNFPSYLFTAPVKTVDKKNMTVDAEGNYFRLFHFIEKSQTINAAKNPEQAFEAAKQFGMFTKLLSVFPVNELKITLPHFHNLTLRYRQFNNALKNADAARLSVAKESINFIHSQKNTVGEFEKIKANANFKIRVTHHDTKISNVLFDKKNKGLCVIDLDTVMPGYFISDVGDMMRTYLCEFDENETDLSKIKIRKDYFEAVAKGYLDEMKMQLSDDEINAFVYAGKFLIYMQVLRFLTDYLNNDIYYGAKYSLQNLHRAENQIALLKDFIQKENSLKEIVERITDSKL
jgi:Ser/Thr protein kinase RdoA (MazF antagonist)